MNEKIINSIKILTNVYYDLQSERIDLDGKLSIKKNGDEKKHSREVDEGLLSALAEHRANTLALEEAILHGEKSRKSIDPKTGKTITIKGNKEYCLATIVHEHPLWKNFLCGIKGLGEMMAAVIMSEFDIRKADTVSKLWSYAGLNPGMIRGKKTIKITSKTDMSKVIREYVNKTGVRTGIIVSDEMVRGDKKTPGYVCPFNAGLRSKLIGVLGSGFLKAKSPYAEFYYNMKQRLESENWGMESKNPVNKARAKAGHQHAAAMRYMVKMFLKDLYVAWRTLEGLPVREPYQEEYLRKKHAIA